MFAGLCQQVQLCEQPVCSRLAAPAIVIKSIECSVQEWGHKPVNYYNESALESLFQLLTPHYAIVYIRPHSGQRQPGYVGDHSKGAASELGDFELIARSFPEVAVFGHLLEAHAPDMGFNEAQLRLHAQARHFVSVLGGNAVLASYFADVNIIYATEGTETHNPDWEYGQLYAKLAGGRILHADTYLGVLQLAQQHLVPAGQS